GPSSSNCLTQASTAICSCSLRLSHHRANSSVYSTSHAISRVFQGYSLEGIPSMILKAAPSMATPSFPVILTHFCAAQESRPSACHYLDATITSLRCEWRDGEDLTTSSKSQAVMLGQFCYRGENRGLSRNSNEHLRVLQGGRKAYQGRGHAALPQSQQTIVQDCPRS